MTEDRQKFAAELATISEPVAPSQAAYSVSEVSMTPYRMHPVTCIIL